MFQYKKRSKDVIIAEKKTEALNAKLLQATANLDYLAMMTDVDIDTINEEVQYEQ